MQNTKFFKPKAHILKLLGKELIKSPIMAIYELVKNSYDADSTFCKVSFHGLTDLENAKILIEDDGTGLTTDVIENVWLEPGTDNRKPFDRNGERLIQRSPIFDRVPMGEKGVGRFAVHKLGDKIRLVTRPATFKKDRKGKLLKVKGKVIKEVLDYEIELIIDWNSFSQSKYLEDIPITWKTITDTSNFTFKENSGTLIEISGIQEPWTRRMARSLRRNTISMLSPKNNKSEFYIKLDFGNDWLDGFPNANQIIEFSPYKFTALLDENYNLTYDYEFSLALNESFGKRELKNKTENIRGELIPILRKELEYELLTDEEIENQIEKLRKRTNPFGAVMLEIFSFDLDPETMKNYTYERKTVKNILKQHYGIKVFKDEMRVYDYGEPGNDWLELDIRRVQSKQWFSNNQNIGYIYLDSEDSTKLVEKTNREGFINDDTFRIFYQCVIAILNKFRIERLKDRNKWLLHIKDSDSFSSQNYISNFKNIIDSTDFSSDEQKLKLKEEADKLEKEFEDKKQTLLIPAGVGMTASVALHEIEKLVPRMREVINSKPFKQKTASEQVEELDEYLDGILSVLRKGGNKPISLEESLKKAVSNYSSKLNRRKIKTEFDLDSDAVMIKCDKRYFITMIMNIIDNSIYWLDTIYKEVKGIYIKTVHEEKSISVIIVDNGPGFKDDVTDIVRPFFSRKEDGIGIGLYLIDTIMIKYGKFEIIDTEEEFLNFSIPKTYRGAAVKLTFNKNL